MREDVDKKALQKLHEKGIDIPDIRLSEWVKITEI